MLSATDIVVEMKRLQVGLRCVLGTGGFHHRPEGVSPEDMRKVADRTIGSICANLIRLRAAEEVIRRWGREAEYEMIHAEAVEGVNAQVEEKFKVPPADMRAVARAARKSAQGVGA